MRVGVTLLLGVVPLPEPARGVPRGGVPSGLAGCSPGPLTNWVSTASDSPARSPRISCDDVGGSSCKRFSQHRLQQPRLVTQNLLRRCRGQLM